MSFLPTQNLQNFDLLLVGITIAAVGILGFTVFLNSRNSITHKTFFLFSITTIAYGSLNYLSYQVFQPDLAIWFIRFTLFLAIWHAFVFFHFTYVFPSTGKIFPWHYRTLLIPLAAISSLATLTPLVFAGINLAPTGQIPQPVPGPAIILFAGTVAFFVVSGVFLLAKKTLKATGLEKSQFQIVSTGTFITLISLIVFNLVFPVLLKNVQLIPLAPIFFLPFIVLTTYAIIRYQFLNIKVIATEILTFVLAIVTLLEVVLSQQLEVLMFRFAVFLLVLGFGILLIRSVRKEVEQREQMEKLMKDLANANQELKRLDRVKSEFVSIASHQLRTPLTAIKGYASLILEGTYGAISKKMQLPMKNVYDSNERLIRLVNDLLSLSRIESGKMELDIEKADIGKVINGVLNELKIKAEQKKIRLAFKEPARQLAPVFIDAEKIRNVILNLVDNSIRYTKKGSITVYAVQTPNKTQLTVHDTGEGMSKEEIAKLFESFSRGQAGVKLSTEGAGLGLYIARQFVAMHKGKIWAESPGKGKGSTFFIELPLRPAS